MSQVPMCVERVALADETDHARRAGRRGQVERLLELAENLLPEDRLLLRQVFELGVKSGDIARQMGCDRGRVYRRIRKLVQRLRSPLFTFVLRRQQVLSGPQRQVARRIILQGLTQREAAARTGMSMHEVRTHFAALQVMGQAAAMVE